MSQNSLGAFVAKMVNNALAPMLLDALQKLRVNIGGTLSSLNNSAAAAIKATPGCLVRVVVVNGGTASNGNFTLNDCATTGAAAAGNKIIDIPSGTAAGTVISLEWPCAVGITLSAVPSAGSPIIAIAYD